MKTARIVFAIVVTLMGMKIAHYMVTTNYHAIPAVIMLAIMLLLVVLLITL